MRFGKPNPREGASGGLRAGRTQPVDAETPRPDFTSTPRTPLGGATPAGEHSLLSGDVHYDTVEASVVAGDLLYGNSTPLWDRLPIGSSGYVLTVSAGLPAWVDPAHALLSTRHSDTVANAVSRGSLIYGNSTPAWTELTIGASGYVLRSDGTDLAWSADTHALLSTRHSDTLASAVSRGSLIYGNSTPAWAELSIGASGTVLCSDGTDVAWSTDTHALLSARHSDTLASAVSRGSLIYGNTTPAWAELAIGTAGYVLASDGTDVAWSADAHNLLSTRHGDAAAGSVVRGDLIIGNATPKFARVAIGAANTCLRSDGTDAAWSTGILDSNARVAIKKNGTLVATRRGVNFIEGSNVTLTIADDSGNEEVDVTIAQTSVSAATVIAKEAGSVVTASADTLDFGAGFDLAESPAGEVNITLDASEVFTGGDLTWSTNAPTVAKIQNIAVPAPTSAEDEKALVYDHGTTAFVYRERLVQYSLWRRLDISGVGVGGEMPMLDGLTTGIVMPASGVVKGVSVVLSGDVGGVGDSYFVQVRKATSSGGAYASFAPSIDADIVGDTGTERSAYDLAGAGTFNAGDFLTVADGEGGAAAAVESLATIYVVFDV